MQKHRAVIRAENIIEPFLADLQSIVNIDSGTYTKAGVDRVGEYLQRRFREFGFATYFDPQHEYGNHLVATHKGQAPDGPRILLIGHIDTVFPAGEVERRPYTLAERDGKPIARGPGILDMKSGVLIGMYGLHQLIDAKQAHYQQVTFICNSDEEVGSPSSKALIQELAQQADIALVLEPGRSVNMVVSARKGVGNYRVEVQGVAAHAGVDPQNGRSAILELAHQVIALQAINGTIPDVTLNVGIIHGGERTNIVSDFAYCEIDVRISDQESASTVEAALRRVTAKSVLDGTKISLSGGMRCMPFEHSERSSRLLQLVKEAGLELELQIHAVSSGGGSDANTVAPLGIPTIDGLGAGGSLAHNPDEYIELDTLPTRIALFTGLIERIGKHYHDGQTL